MSGARGPEAAGTGFPAPPPARRRPAEGEGAPRVRTPDGPRGAAGVAAPGPAGPRAALADLGARFGGRPLRAAGCASPERRGPGRAPVPPGPPAQPAPGRRASPRRGRCRPHGWRAPRCLLSPLFRDPAAPSVSHWKGQRRRGRGRAGAPLRAGSRCARRGGERALPGRAPFPFGWVLGCAEAF